MKERASTTSDLLEFMLNHADAWLIMVGTDRIVTAWNATARDESGYDRTDFATLPELVDLLVPEAAERVRMLAVFDELEATGERVAHLRTRVVTRAGDERTIAWSIDFLPDPGSPGERLAVAMGIDLTDRLAGDRVLQRNETIHRLLLENLQEGIWWIDPEGRSRYANARLAELLGVHAAELVGMPIDGFLAIGLDALAAPVCEDAKLRRADGSLAFVHVSGGPLDPTRDGVNGALLSIVDLSVQRRLVEEHALLVQAVTQASESIVITDADATIRYVNPSFTRITGYSQAEAIGQNPRILQSGEHDCAFYAALWEQLASGHEWKGVFRNRRRDGTLYSEEASISPVHDEDGTITGYIGVKRDVTRELELQEYLQTSQKLQAVGTLAGGVAHDFNNILMAVLGYAELARSEAAPDSPLARQLDSIRTAAGRARDLADQLLTFSRGGTPVGGPTDMAQAVSEAVAMLRSTTPTTIAITTDLEETQYRVRVGPTEIVQIVMNLGLNAVAAIDPDANGHITITLHTESTPQPSLVLTVSDDGVGMDDETLARVFEPFFSTRPVGKGTGMGLAVVHGITSGSGGTIRATSAVGEGTSFGVILPAVLVEEAENEVVDPACDGRPSIRDASGMMSPQDAPLIMVVDDEPALVGLLGQSLGNHGFRVEGFTDPLAAYDRFAADPSLYALVLTDIAMPELRGDQFAGRVRSLRPETPIVGYTGYSETVDESRAAAAGIRRLLRKPLDLNELAEVLTDILEEEKHEQRADR